MAPDERARRRMAGCRSRMVESRATRTITFAVVACLGLAAIGWWSLVRPARAREREARAAIARGQAHLKRGRPALALQAVSRTPEDGPSGADVLCIRGMAL